VFVFVLSPSKMLFFFTLLPAQAAGNLIYSERCQKSGAPQDSLHRFTSNLAWPTGTWVGPEVCGSTRTRGYTRPDPYPRVGSRTSTTSTGRGIPGFARKEQDFSRFWSENHFICACFLNYLRRSNCSLAPENSIGSL